MQHSNYKWHCFRGAGPEEREIPHEDLQKLAELHGKNISTIEKDIIKFKEVYKLINR